MARLGGDEFLVVCEQLDGPHEAIRVAERVAQAINQPIVLASGEHFVSASIGIAVAERADADPADLLRDADAAMYRAKERGRGRYELFDDLLRRRVLVRLRTENELRRGIDQGELRVVYQPIVELARRQRGRRRGARALAASRARAARPGRVHPRRGGLGA